MEFTVHSISKACGVTLIVFHSEARCWQFLIVISKDLVWVDDSIFLAQQGAEEAGQRWIEQLRTRSH